MIYQLSSGGLAEPAPANDIDALTSHPGFTLPDDYIAFLRQHDGGEGDLGDDYVMLWKAAELGDFNREYQTDVFAPGIFLFGSNGGGEAYGFDLADPAMPVVSIPFVGMDLEQATEVAPRFSDMFAPSQKPVESRLFSGLLSRSKVSRRSNRPTRAAGMEIFEITPIILGGSPTDPKNKTLVTRQQHFQAVRYWNKMVADLRRQQGG
jgi:cell wall assembly regulator SMI1